MAVLETIKPNVSAVRLIASVAPDFKKHLNLPKHISSIGIITADSDDVAYIAADEATKQADVEVFMGSSFYAGAGNTPSPTSGEVIIILGASSPAEVRAGIDAMMATIEEGPKFQWADDQNSIAFLAYLVSSTGTYLSAQAGIKVGQPLAYLIAPALEATLGIDAALKAAAVEMAVYVPPPSPTNYSGAFLTGTQAACSAACSAFADAVIDVGRTPIKL